MSLEREFADHCKGCGFYSERSGQPVEGSEHLE